MGNWTINSGNANINDAPAGMAYNNTITVDGDYTLEVNQATIDAQGIADLAVGLAVTLSNKGKLRIVNSSTATALRYMGPESGTLTVNALCTLEILGDYIVLQASGGGAWVSSGAAGQTIPTGVGYGWTGTGFVAADEPAVIFVETGNGTNVWEPWLNVGALALTDFGVGTLGKFFSYNTTTGVITFGDNGKPQTLTGNANSGQTKVNITDATAYAANDWIHIIDNNGRETVKIASKNGNELTLAANLTRTFTTAAGAYVRLSKGCNIPVTGARVRVYNIGLGKVNSGGTPGIHATVNTNYKTNTSASYLNISKMYCFGFRMNVQTALSATVDDIGIVVYGYIYGNRNLTLNRWYRSINRYYDDTSAVLFEYDYDCEFNDFVIANKNWSYGIEMLDSQGCTFNNFFTVTGLKNSSGDSPLFMDRCSDCVFNDPWVIGGVIYPGIGNTLNDVVWSDAPTGYRLTSNMSYIAQSSNQPGLGSIIDGLSICVDGNIADTGAGVFNALYSAKNVDVSAVGAYTIYLRCSAHKFYKCKFSATDSIQYGLETARSIEFTHITQHPATKLPFWRSSNISSGQVIKACDGSTTVPISKSGIFDTHFYELRTGEGSPDPGVLGLFFFAKTGLSNAYTTSGTVEFSQSGSLYLKSAGASITYTWPHKIIGVIAFPVAGSLVLGGSGTANFTVEGSIDGGATWINLVSGWATWAALTTAPTGMDLKVRITHNAGSSANYLNKLQISTSVNYTTYQYPEDYVSLTIENVKDESRYWVYDEDGSLIGNGTQSGTGNIVINNIPYYGTSRQLLVKVRRSGVSEPDYWPFQTYTTLTSTGARAWVEQSENPLEA